MKGSGLMKGLELIHSDTTGRIYINIDEYYNNPIAYLFLDDSGGLQIQTDQDEIFFNRLKEVANNI